MNDLPTATETALCDAWAWLAERLPGGWAEPGPGMLAAVTGLPAPTLNGVWCRAAGEGTGRGDAGLVMGMLERVAAAGLPHCVQFPVGAGALAELARARGLTRDADLPLMRLDATPNAPEVPELEVRRLRAEEADLHARVAAAGFGAPESVFAPLVSPPLAGDRDLGYYVGSVAGEPVVTGLGLRRGVSVGVFNVATVPDARRRGYGAALTAAIVADARNSGASWAWLQSSGAGHGVYERLGFVDVALWECWVGA
ncbi:GNAT family N-acetyltransferase [Gryllotalpicola ginsengisoli]|uniref:GNAT family N-acetyltransferase n=1 Tax=Gryllotalpicola ginsengisoli TaxID=444608 RepID=UPI0003B776FF|nr:GNAT family N-acetyltransferase [Gryllotalpicola ginsengisoli]